MTFYIEQIKIDLAEDKYGLRLTALDHELPLPGQSIEEAKNTITENFEIVSTKYKKSTLGIIPTEELNEVCLKVVLYYFYLYNSWRSIYEKEKVFVGIRKKNNVYKILSIENMTNKIYKQCEYHNNKIKLDFAFELILHANMKTKMFKINLNQYHRCHNIRYHMTM